MYVIGVGWGWGYRKQIDKLILHVMYVIGGGGVVSKSVSC